MAENGFSSSVKVVAKKSFDMQIGVDMDDKADILVSEILSNELLGEGVVASIEDAKRRLLKPGAQIIPARGAIKFALFEGADIEKNLWVDEVYGFDLRPFNEIVTKKQDVYRNDLNIEFLTDETSAFLFDFQNIENFKAEKKRIAVPVRKAGRCCGLIQWIQLDMNEEVTFENNPLVKVPASGWQHVVYLFQSPINVVPGQIARITATHNRSCPWFFLESIS